MKCTCSDTNFQGSTCVINAKILLITNYINMCSCLGVSPPLFYIMYFDFSCFIEFVDWLKEKIYAGIPNRNLL